MALEYIHTGFENGSPLDGEIDAAGVIHVRLLYDHERGSPNRAAGHWHFQLHARAGDTLTLVLENFDNIWNGRPGSPISERTSCFLSPDGRTWSATPAPKIAGNRLQVSLTMPGDRLFLARLEPYRLSDLERLLSEIRAYPQVEITRIGQTVEGRALEIVRVGDPAAPHHVLVRARSHPWEPGGNWVVQGLIRRLLEDDPAARRCRERYCLHVMPMAAKDGVVRGHTRFNLLGMDLNRGWDRPADPALAPENAALESWLETMVGQGRRPDLAIDLHNDNSGRLHQSSRLVLPRPMEVLAEPRSRPPGSADPHLAAMERLERLLREHTWFREGTSPGAQGAWTFGEGLLARYGIDACILELNCDWIEGLEKVPFGADWEQFGGQMSEVLLAYFAA
jgi:hypothetical protein